ncbi:MAG TPA: hypothetical protein VNF07_13285 [Acidimicrobiales bacterium]|nr:hypothetical protein [Acidimicrobiales bacterium]
MDDPAPAPQPPGDADDWTSEQWIDWLMTTDVEDPPEPSPPLPTVTNKVVRSGVGQALGQAMVAVDQVLYGGREKPAAVAPAPGEPEDRLLELRLDPDHPERSSVTLRREVDEPPEGR